MGSRAGLIFRGVAAVALAFVGCGLVTPFEPSPSADGGAPDTDADGEDGGRPDGDAGRDGGVDAEPDADGDASSYDYLAGCVGGVTEERWVVAALDGHLPLGYLTGRDCAAPMEICAWCYPSAISPNGNAVIIASPPEGRWRVQDELRLVHLDGPEIEEEPLDLRGAHPAWADDDSFYYLAAPAGVTEPCLEGEGHPEPTEMRRHTLSTGEDVVVPPPLDRAWNGGGIVPDLEGTWLAVSEEASGRCDVTNLAVTRVNLVTGGHEQLPWTGDFAMAFVLGVLPDGSGFLMQRLDRSEDTTSRLYAIPFEGRGVRILRDLVVETARDLWLLLGPTVGEETPSWARSIWSGCATDRRVGPSCEIYCESSTGSGIDRYYLDGRAPEPVVCEGLGDDVRIMDVWQR